MRMKKGFTIIEVALVLAIAGMIILLAFIALPGLQRSQRDSERKDDMMMLADAVKKFQTNNNRGALPKSADELSQIKSSFLKNDFDDPDGYQYLFVYDGCTDVSNAGAGCAAANNALSKETFNTHHIYFVAGASCNDNSEAVKSSNARKAAIMYRLELADSIFCYDL